MKHPKVLILIKKGHEYTNQLPSSTMKAGLLNSASFIKDALIEKLGIPTTLEICVDGNDIDRKIHKHKPTHCFLEALWVTPEKLRELATLHKHIKFVVRIHSKIPFLGNEGSAIGWIKEYVKIGQNVSVAFNNKHTATDFKKIGVPNNYLPNLYTIHKKTNLGYFGYLVAKIKDTFKCKVYKTLNVGCFGAIRPLKNQLLQAVAAVEYADKHGLELIFHINGTRVEQRGEAVLKNIRALFENTKHTLVEHPWLSHEDFLKVVEKMDLGVQLSFTESFNIVTADFVVSGVPVIVGKDIEWTDPVSKCDPNNTNRLLVKMEYALAHKHLVKHLNLKALTEYNSSSLEVWCKYFKHHKH